MHWILHVTGIDTQASPFYDFWSGFGACMAWIGTAVAVTLRHNCHHHWCPRIGRFKDGDSLYCRRHHPRKGEALG